MKSPPLSSYFNLDWDILTTLQDPILLSQFVSAKGLLCLQFITNCARSFLPSLQYFRTMHFMIRGNLDKVVFLIVKLIICV